MDTLQLDYGDDYHRLLQGGNLSSSSNLTHMRITFNTEAIEKKRNENTTEIIDHIENVVLNQARDIWSSHLILPATVSPLAYDSSVCLGIFGPGTQQQGDVVTPGRASGTDLLVFVTAYETLTAMSSNNTLVKTTLCVPGVLALAFACQIDQNDRPVIGVINFCLNNDFTENNSTFADKNLIFPSFFQEQFGSFFQTSFQDSQIRTNLTKVALHEMCHVLGFSFELFKYFRYPSGAPRTPRPFSLTTQMCPNGQTVTTSFPSTDTVRMVTFNGQPQFRFVTPHVTTVSRNFFNCPTLAGARLDDPAVSGSVGGDVSSTGGSASNCMGSHWNEREQYGEVMKPQYAPSSQNILSALTLSLLEDSGWYLVDYRNTETPSFGLGTGCEFVTQSCIQNDTVPIYGMDDFCDTPISFSTVSSFTTETLSTAAMCDPAHQYWVTCDLYNTNALPYSLIPPGDVAVFTNNPSLLSVDPVAEYCPVPSNGLGRDCTVNDASYNAFYPGEALGTDSKCIVTNYQKNGLQAQRPACFSLICDASLGVVIDLGNGNQVTCVESGQVLHVQSSDGQGNTRNFNLTCPRLASVCPLLYSCPSQCSGRGTCVYNASHAYCDCTGTGLKNEGCYPTYGSVAQAIQPQIVSGAAATSTNSPGGGTNKIGAANTPAPTTVAPVPLPSTQAPTPVTSRISTTSTPSNFRYSSRNPSPSLQSSTMQTNIPTIGGGSSSTQQKSSSTTMKPTHFNILSNIPLLSKKTSGGKYVRASLVGFSIMTIGHLVVGH